MFHNCEYHSTSHEYHWYRFSREIWRFSAPKIGFTWGAWALKRKGIQPPASPATPNRHFGAIFGAENRQTMSILTSSNSNPVFGFYGVEIFTGFKALLLNLNFTDPQFNLAENRYRQFLAWATVGAHAIWIISSVRQSVCFCFYATSCEVVRHDVPTHLLSPLDCWQNSTPFFGMYALCAMEIGDSR